MKKNERLRSIAFIILGILILLLAIFIGSKIVASKKSPELVKNTVIKKVYVETVKNTTIDRNINATGNIQALRKIELYAEVQGIFKRSSKLFKAGQNYGSGSTLLQLDNSEYHASIVAARSNLFNLLMTAMADINLDYPQEAVKWQNYLQNFNVNNSVPNLPQFTNDQEKFFISGKGIINAYYNVKNMEERLMKYTIYAPFNGILTEALVTEGALIRSGQKLGEFIDPSKYELEVSISEAYKDQLKVGNKVDLFSLDKTKKYSGFVSRVNAVVNPSTQSVQVFIAVQGKDLQEGMYLEAELEGKKIQDAYEISRKLLVDNKAVMLVKDGKLELQVVEPIHFTEETAIVKGLEDGSVVLAKSISGAYSGMLVEIEENK